MFFKELKRWSKKKLTFLWLLFEFIYFCLMCVAPICTILIKYDLYKNKGNVISGVALVMLLVIGVCALHNFKKVINKFDENTPTQQRIKYTLNCIYGLVFPIGMIVLSYAFLDNVKLAHSTLCICCAFFIGGICIEHLFIAFLDRERFIRSQARFDLEKQDRINANVL